MLDHLKAIHSASRTPTSSVSMRFSLLESQQKPKSASLLVALCLAQTVLLGLGMRPLRFSDKLSQSTFGHFGSKHRDKRKAKATNNINSIGFKGRPFYQDEGLSWAHHNRVPWQLLPPFLSFGFLCFHFVFLENCDLQCKKIKKLCTNYNKLHTHRVKTKTLGTFLAPYSNLLKGP